MGQFFFWKPRPDSGLDCLICAMLAREQLTVKRFPLILTPRWEEFQNGLRSSKWEKLHLNFDDGLVSR